MNLALQKRHEQLERWRRNEASVELDQQQHPPLQDTETITPVRQTSIQQNQRKPLALSTRNSAPYSTSPGLSKDNSLVGSNNDNNNANNAPKSNSLGDALLVSKQSAKGRINKKGKPNSKPQVRFSDSTLFLTACANSDLTECKRLLSENSVNIDTTTSDGLTGLHEAAICGNTQLVEFLIEQGANINCCDNEGWTPLHAAASLGQVDIVKLLMDLGADATIVNCDNLLAYDLARNDQVQGLIVEHLNGADIDYLRSQEERAIQNDIDRWIRTGQYDERSHPITNATVLHVLAAKGYVKQMKQILGNPTLKKQINLEACDSEGFTPLLAASFWSQPDIVEMLIEHGANIFAQADCGYKISSIHLKNYQQSKFQQSQAGTRSPLNSEGFVDTRQSTTSIDSSATDLTYDDSESIRSGSAPKHLRSHGQLLKSHSLDIGQQAPDAPTTLAGSMSVDRLLLRSESMTERELRKSYKELVMEFERVRRQLKGIDEREKQKQQDWIRKERQLQRKISELEEENRQLDHWKQEVQRLKDENTSLVRVVSKLSKQN